MNASLEILISRTPAFDSVLATKSNPPLFQMLNVNAMPPGHVLDGRGRRILSWETSGGITAGLRAVDKRTRRGLRGFLKYYQGEVVGPPGISLER